MTRHPQAVPIAAVATVAAVAAIAALAAVLLSGCSAPAPQPSATKPPPATAAPADGASLAPAPAPTGDPVTADSYSTALSNDSSPISGVDFDSADGNIHCGIFDPHNDGQPAPFSGCLADQYDFAFATTDSAAGAANSVIVEGTDAGVATSVTGIEFAGQDPHDYPHVKRLPEGTSITWSTVSCVAIENGIRCTNTASGHGFFLSRIKYQLF